MQRWPHGQILHTRLVLKLDLQRELNNSPEGVGVSECRWISGGLYDTESIYVATATGDGTSENVAVEGIQEIGAEQNVGSFGESGPLIEAEIFVEITLSHRASRKCSSTCPREGDGAITRARIIAGNQRGRKSCETF